MDHSHISLVISAQTVEKSPVLLRCLHSVSELDPNMSFSLGPLVHLLYRFLASVLVTKLRILGKLFVPLHCLHHSVVPAAPILRSIDSCFLLPIFFSRCFTLTLPQYPAHERLLTVAIRLCRDIRLLFVILSQLCRLFASATAFFLLLLGCLFRWKSYL